MFKQFVKFKTGLINNRLFSIHPLVLMVVFDMANWCHERDIDFTLTDGLTTEVEDEKVGRKFLGHREGRCVDIRSSVFDKYQLKEFESYFNAKYKDIAAVSSGDGKRRLVVIHNGTARHIHIQIHKSFAIYE